ncbi:uncharacterized protein BDZ99DRAFT_467932 [Mytilinidion resinicola]|uniref:Uncharacterized protein n=1 Tax=Mytilinidion resinicola TaxID=574789 RepID=A0A6A6Y6I9_9PEZI|nr:uncharacterized protein BDZ99DRAFT_467932 [Mytilinidion resinicola]KAF2803815.1 hypothetical protein BDZ99DRAFT_467932 [Mytilinidion resinicola]
MPPHLPPQSEESDQEFSQTSDQNNYEVSDSQSDQEFSQDLDLEIRQTKRSTLRALCDELYNDMLIQRTLIKLHETKFKSGKAFEKHCDKTIEQWYITADFIRHVKDEGDLMDEDELDDDLAKGEGLRMKNKSNSMVIQHHSRPTIPKHILFRERGPSSHRIRKRSWDDRRAKFVSRLRRPKFGHESDPIRTLGAVRGKESIAAASSS